MVGLHMLVQLLECTTALVGHKMVEVVERTGERKERHQLFHILVRMMEQVLGQVGRSSLWHCTEMGRQQLRA